MRRYNKIRRLSASATNIDDTISSDNSSLSEQSYVPDYEEFASIIDARLTSSPVHLVNEEELNVTDDGDSSCSSDDTMSEELYPDSGVTIQKFSINFLDIVSKHQISDAASESFLELFAKVLPLPNACPTIHKLENLQNIEHRWSEVKSSTGTYYLLDLTYQIQSILNYNTNLFDWTPSEDISDIKSGTAFSSFDTESTKFIYLILSVDGISSFFSSRQYKMWAVMASIVNLPATLRKRFENILFCSLFYGSLMPDFTEFMKLVVDQLQSCSFMTDNHAVRLKVVTLCADLPAKAKCLNSVQFNGFYGCNVCYKKGTYDNECRKMLFPSQEESSQRTAASYLEHARVAEETGSPVYGVKGYSPLSQLIAFQDIPFDPMHLLHLGLVRTFILHLLSHKLIDENQVSRCLVDVAVPASFRRKPRNLSFKHKFKATEWKHVILYYIPLFFTVENHLVNVFLLLLSCVIRMLSTRKITAHDCADAMILINKFRRLAIQLFGESVQSFSMHAFGHLPQQVRMYGGLWNVSASSFESAYYQLKRLLTGTRNEGQLVVKRFLRWRLLSERKEMHGFMCLKVMGALVDTFEIDSVLYNFIPSDGDRLVYRFQHHGNVFHSFSYPKKRSSASYFVVLCDQRFARIDHIIQRHNELFCLCTELVKLRSAAQDFTDHSDTTLLRHCKLFIVAYGDKFICSASSINNHVIVINKGSDLYATSVLDSFEHD